MSMLGANGSLIRLLRGGSGKSAVIAARCVMSRLGELRQEAEWRKCVRSEKYFLEHYWYIAHPAEGRILFKLRSAQAEALEQWAANRYSLSFSH